MCFYIREDSVSPAIIGRKLKVCSLQASLMGDLAEGQGCASVWQCNTDSNNFSKAFSPHMQRRWRCE